jgi:hypothetical protein
MAPIRLERRSLLTTVRVLATILHLFLKRRKDFERCLVRQFAGVVDGGQETSLQSRFATVTIQFMKTATLLMPRTGNALSSETVCLSKFMGMDEAILFGTLPGQ